MLQRVTAAALIYLFSSAGALMFGQEPEPEIQDVIPKDRILAIWSPTFVSAEEAEIEEESPVIGVEINGEAHCYSPLLLNAHEIVNDEVGGKKIAVTW